ncbi:2-oxoglutarate (2OG) and Fe(II)-dependent oxygenase superfamily protein [Zea mays]|uniref:2-oxoglutarate (2OG) and Fe(II)-dependent oxygenase superfamily protein n=1 Tax=Zea mays TaxID=4577 RepID=A0A1D6GAL3_MAIZE|nr:2-oxoglutarate (2OG) and Fe(II)-dependent oxygenase superfamily protein [Zea mays]
MGEEREFVGARLDAGLRAARFSSPPSADEFAADVEPKNVPAEKVGPDVAVEAMMSNTGHVFYGDLRSHERAGFCSGLANYKSSHMDENKEGCSLQVLEGDIQEPIFLRGKSFSSINFWMNKGHLRSSTHYDPHHNLLCVVSGRKKVTLWPPSASPFLYPLPVYGEASNHSSVSVEEPDYSIYTRARYMKEYSETVILNCSDVVFIPEGWYHQVDSDDLTIAVNFWWKSRIMTQMLEHMDAYYLRRIMSRYNHLRSAHRIAPTSYPTMKN